MSRYIDADKLEPDTEWDEYEDGFISYSQLNIDTAETADVVPKSAFEQVKWERDYERKCKEKYMAMLDCAEAIINTTGT